MSATAVPRLLDSRGTPVVLAPKPFAIGGEGAIHEVVGTPSLVAKVYNRPQSSERSAKLAAMARMATPELQGVAAWPFMTLHVASGSAVAGVLMPRIAGFKEIHHLYSVAQRKKDYPEADWRFLIHAARNCAAAFETIHGHGHVVGDVNQKNVMVSDQALVRLVDCDSFQVRAGDGRVFRCVVGVPEYTPPELQGASFRGVDRDADHDLFGLAVMIFHLLMMGRHPFSGVFQGPGDMPLEKAIAEGRFAYARDAHANLMSPPPNTLPTAFIDGPLLDLFEAAFRPPGKGTPPRRPSAAAWRGALAAFLGRLGGCDVDSRHYFPKNPGGCPWCALATGRGLIFFLPKSSATAAGVLTLDSAAVWREVERIAAPGKAVVLAAPASNAAGRPVPPAIPRPSPRPGFQVPPDPTVHVDPFLNVVAAVGIAAGLVVLIVAPPVGVGCIVAFTVWLIGLQATREGRRKALQAIRDAEIREVRRHNDSLQKAWEADNPDWTREYVARVGRRDELRRASAFREEALAASDAEAERAFGGTRRNLEAARSAYDRARAAFDAEMNDLARESVRIQHDQYLDSFLIRDARLARVSVTVVASLGSFGIETAFDVQGVLQVKVPGVGPVLTQRLIDWRNDLSRRFVPKAGVPDSAKVALEQRRLPGLKQHAAVLSAGPGQLRAIAAKAEATRARLVPEIAALRRRLRQAEADVAIMDRLAAG